MRLYRNLSFFCSGKEIVYGTNLSSLVNIFIDSEFMNTINIPELYQLMGRVGRMGRSYHANIITTSQEIVDKLLSFDESFESENDIVGATPYGCPFVVYQFCGQSMLLGQAQGPAPTFSGYVIYQSAKVFCPKEYYRIIFVVVIVVVVDWFAGNIFNDYDCDYDNDLNIRRRIVVRSA